MFNLTLKEAVVSVLGKREDPSFTDVGLRVTIGELYKALGLSATPMLYNYISGKTKDIEPERALVFLEQYNILLKQWNSPDELRADCTNRELGKKIAYKPIEEIMNELVELSQMDDDRQMRRGLLGLIARNY